MFSSEMKTPELLAAFRNASSWPNTCSVSCWWCCHPFSTVPIPTVKGYDERKDSFLLQGVFCSWSCAKAFLMDGSRDWSRNTMYLFQLRRRVEGRSTGITPAPNRYFLNMFGGTMTIDEFRSHGDSATIVQILEPPLCIIKNEISVRDSHRVHQKAPSESTSTQLSQAIVSNTVKNDNLRLKRSGKSSGLKGGLLQQMNITVSAES